MATKTQKKADKSAEVTVSKDSDLTVLRAVQEAKREAEDAKKRRMALNRRNMGTYMGLQDWSHKQAGQSREFLPKTPVAVEQFTAFIKKALTQFGDWFSVDLPPDSPLKDYQVRDMLKCFLDYLADGMRATTSFPLRLSDGCKLAQLEAIMVFKIHGFKVPERVYTAERSYEYKNGQQVTKSSLKQKFRRPWRLAIDLVRAEDYFPDPTNRHLYEIHRVECDLHDIIELAEQGIYDKTVVDQLVQDFDDRTKEYQDQSTRNQQGVIPPPFRRTGVIDEYWGDLLKEDGHLAARNIVCAVANEKYVIRKPEDNPNWHGESPFVSMPLIRVPGTVWHKAMYDHGSPLNLALNELFNLMLDGGLASVWGIKQLRMGGLEDPRQVTGGVAQGMTLAVKDEFPQGEKVLETVTTGQVPQDAMSMFTLADREFNASILSNDLKMGLLPPKEVKATEVVEIQQSQAVTLDGIATDMEAPATGIPKILEKAWMTILQNADNLDAEEIVAAIGPRAALLLSRMSPAERFAAFARYGFRAHGLSATLARVRDFQKWVASQQFVTQNPWLQESQLRRMSADKALDYMYKLLNMNPEDFGLAPNEQADLPNRVNRMAALAQTFGMGKGPVSLNTDQSGGDTQLPAEINQIGNPLSGMGG